MNLLDGLQNGFRRWCVERTFASGNPPQGCTPPSPALSIVAPAVKAVSRGLSLHHPLTPFFKQLQHTGERQDFPLESGNPWERSGGIIGLRKILSILLRSPPKAGLDDGVGGRQGLALPIHAASALSGCGVRCRLQRSIFCSFVPRTEKVRGPPITYWVATLSFTVCRRLLNRISGSRGKSYKFTYVAIMQQD